MHKSHLEWFIEEVLHRPGHAHGKAKGVPDDVEAEEDDVHLLDGLAGVVPGHLTCQIVNVEELVLPLKVGKPEDDVIAVSDGDAEALDQMLDEIGAPVASMTADSLSSSIVRCQRETDVDLERRQMEVVIEVLLPLGHRQHGVVLQLLPRVVQVHLQLLHSVLLQDLLLFEKLADGVDEAKLDLEMHLLHQGVDVLVLLEVVLRARVFQDAQLNEGFWHTHCSHRPATL